MSIPIIDLFAGPGGLGEGFSAVRDGKGRHAFNISLSIEKEASAFSTLTLRAAYRHLREGGLLAPYFDYIRDHISWTEFQGRPSVADAFVAASREARQYELGKTSERQIDREIRAALGGTEDWLLIGGPPCQAYSLVGRARRANDSQFASDEKHFLYREYLRIIRQHRPAVFVMENVKGMLSSRHSGEGMFERIREDLSRPLRDLEYELCSFVRGGGAGELQPEDYVIEAERYGVPQTRHRVILLGIRKGFAPVPSGPLLTAGEKVSVFDAIADLPRLRSRLSREPDSQVAWSMAVTKASRILRGAAHETVRALMEQAAERASTWTTTGAAFMPWTSHKKNTDYSKWIHSEALGGVTLHEARSHMREDLARYLFAAAYAAQHGETPRLRHFPARLLPEHRSAVRDDSGPAAFQDRFRVQLRSHPASTIVSHIAKDGHYYIHYDAAQCRSLTVREAARLQSFPDDYYFTGNRTQQYTQVGNAVPPLLAAKLGECVYGLMTKSAKARAVMPRTETATA
jgi:DNA (cytosine-5)-methyltransferase 1